MDAVFRYTAPFDALTQAGAAGLILASLVMAGFAGLILARLLTAARWEAAAGALARIDRVYRAACGAVSGLRLRRAGLRRAVFALPHTVLALTVLLAPVTIALGAGILAGLLGFGHLTRLLSDRAERRRYADEGRVAVDPLYVEPECWAGLGLCLFTVLAAAIRLAAAPELGQAGLSSILLPLESFWREAAGTVLPGLRPEAEAGWAMNTMRLVFELGLLAGIAALALTVYQAASGRRNADIDRRLDAPDHQTVSAALDHLERRALRNRRTAQSRLLQIAFASNAKTSQLGIGERLRASEALLNVARAFADPALALAAAQAYRQILDEIDRTDSPLSWAQTHIALADAVEASVDLTGDTGTLDEAVAALRAAAQVLTEDSAPDSWALIHDRLGRVHALAAAHDDARWIDAVTALRSALQLRKRGGLPNERALTQEQLARALLRHGKLSRELEPLHEALAMCRDAQEIHARSGDQEGWSRVRLIMAEARRELSRMTGDTGRLQDADAELLHTLKFTPRAHAPLLWAELHHVRGTLQRTLAARTGDAACLDTAIESFETALKVRTRQLCPDEWLETKIQLGETLKAAGEMRRDPAILDKAGTVFREALAALPRGQTARREAGLVFTLGLTLSAQGRLEEDPVRLEEAAGAIEEAIALMGDDPAASQRAGAQHALGIALCALGRLRGDPQTLDTALHAFAEALSARRLEARPSAHAASQARIGETLLALYPLRKDTGLLDRACDAFSEAKQAFERAGDRGRTAHMVEQIRRIRAVHRRRDEPQPGFEEPVTRFARPA